jgi:hypothetical protein
MNRPNWFLVVAATFALVAAVFTTAPAAAAGEPHLMVWWTGEDQIVGSGWTTGTSVTIKVDDPATARSPDWTKTVIVGTGKRALQVSPPIDLRPGHIVTATDGTVTKWMVIQGIIVTRIDVEADTVSGMAEPFSQVASQVWTTRWKEDQGRATMADASGRWVADFSIPGPLPGMEEEGDPVDITSGIHVNALTSDADHDMSFWQGKERSSISVIQVLPDTVDMCLDGTRALLGLSTGDVYSSMPFDAAEPSDVIDLALVAAGSPCNSDAVVEASEVALTRRGSVTAVAHPIAGGSAALDVFTNSSRPTEPHVARVSIRHVADAPSYDLWVDGELVGRESSGDALSFKTRDGVHVLWWSEPGGYLPVIQPKVVKLSQGRAYEIHLTGGPVAGYELITLAPRVGTTS